jgi:hypothetical protein
MRSRLFRGMLFLSAAALPAAAAQSQAQDDFTNSRFSFICRSSSEVREIKTYIFTAEGQGAASLRCRVDYIKGGTTRTLWSSHDSRSYCDEQAARLAAKLESGNFSCQPLHPQTADPG